MAEKFDILDAFDIKKLTQAVALLAALKEHGPLATTVIREILGICHPAGRIKELRARGHKVLTSIVWAADEQGRMHKQALYSLMTGEVCHG